MADTALQNAEKQRDKLAAEINALQSRLEERRKDLQRVEQFLADYKAFSASSPELEFGAGPPPKAAPTKKPTNPDRRFIGDYVEKFLRQAGRPMNREDLFNALKGEGIEIIGKDPMMVFSTMLWRQQERFVRLPGTGYWLVKEPCPAVGYLPPPPVPLPPNPDFLA